MSWHRGACGFLVVLVGLLAGCTSTDHGLESEALLSSSESDGVTVNTTATTAGTQLNRATQDLSETEVSSAVEAYSSFLAIRDDAYMDPGSDLSGLRELAAEAVVSEVEDFWDRNEFFAEGGVATLSRDSLANVVEATADEAGVRIVDCVEMRESHEDDANSPVRFIEQDVLMSPADGSWRVESIRILKAGDVSSTDWFSCVPDYHAKRVGELVATFGDETFSWKSDPSAEVTEALLSSLSSELRVEGEQALEQQREQFGNRYMSGVEERSVKVVGSDVATGGWNFLVELCSFYPSGEIWTDVSSGVEVAQRPPGSATRIGYRVLSTEGTDGEWSDEIVDLTPIESPSPCWDEYGEES